MLSDISFKDVKWQAQWAPTLCNGHVTYGGHHIHAFDVTTKEVSSSEVDEMVISMCTR
jgi:hypothetical protein